MGVPGLYRVILNRYKKTHYWNPDEIIDYLYIDFNVLLYQCYEKIPKNSINIDNLLINEIIKSMNHLICHITRPNKLVYIAMDGPAPKCKIIRQRERRYKRQYEMQIKQQIQEKYGVYEKENWDTNYFTPGTPFMYLLGGKLRKAIVDGEFNKHNKEIQIILSDSNLAGEGEHKLLNHINTADICKTDSICIYSNDGDLLILANKFPDFNITLLTNVNMSIDVMKQYYEKNEFVYFSIKEFQKAFLKEIDLENKEPQRIITDYIFYTMFGGNDFVKPLPFLKMRYTYSFTILLNIYKKISAERNDYLITDTYQLNDPFFREFIKELSLIEFNKIKIQQKKINSYETQNKYENNSWENEFSNYQHRYYYDKNHPEFEKHKNLFEKFTTIITDQQMSYTHQWKKTYYEYFFALDGNDDSDSDVKEYFDGIHNICIKYIKSLIFAFRYYVTGLPSWNWYYPYHVAPLPSDINRVLKKITDVNQYDRFKYGQPYKPFYQLMSVLPPNNTILPEDYLWYMRHKNSPIKRMFPTEFNLEIVSGEKYIYSEPILPLIDDIELINCVNKTPLTREEKKRNAIHSKEFIYQKK